VKSMSRVGDYEFPAKNVQSLAAIAGDRPNHNAASVVNNGLAGRQEWHMTATEADGRTGKDRGQMKKATALRGWPIRLQASFPGKRGTKYLATLVGVVYVSGSGAAVRWDGSPQADGCGVQP
jgi:hypothetical protein